MNIADIIFVILVGVAAVLGYRRDVVRQSAGTIGVLVGFVIAALLYKKLAFLTQSSAIRTIVLFAVLVGMVFLCFDFLSVVGRWLQRKLPKKFRTSRANSIASSAVSAIGSAVIILFLVSAFAGMLPTMANAQVQGSQFLAFLKRTVPLPDAVGSFAGLRQPFASPEIFSGEEVAFKGEPNTLTDSYEALDTATDAVKASVVEVDVWGCGGAANGTGFIVGPRHVITNAHVVAGAEKISVRSGSHTQVGDVVWFDPKLDVALLHVQASLAGQPLALATQSAQPGSIAANLGFATQTNLAVGDVVVLQKLNAVGYDIYHHEQVTRQIYAFRGEIVPGNSGGPLINASGKVIGVIFGHSTTQHRIGYAITVDQVADLLNKSATLTTSVGSGRCTAL